MGKIKMPEAGFQHSTTDGSQSKISNLLNSEKDIISKSNK
jgi:hypothetical protein